VGIGGVQLNVPSLLIFRYTQRQAVQLMGKSLTGGDQAGEGLCEARGRPASVLWPRRLEAVGRRLMMEAVGLVGRGCWWPGPGRGGPNLTGQERVNGVEPVVKVTVAAGLYQVAPLRRHNAAKCAVLIKIKRNILIKIISCYFCNLYDRIIKVSLKHFFVQI
jgi:hypothetical protein